MASGAPDWVTTVAVTVIVENVPVIPVPAAEAAAGAVDRYSGDDADYQELAKWTVTAAKTGELKEVSMITDDYANTVWKLVIGTTTVFEDLVIQSALTLPFFDLRLAAATEVILTCHSDGATAIVADGSIIGKEIG